MRSRGLLILVFTFLTADSICAQGFSPQEALKRMQVPQGFQVKLAACEPDIRQPVTMSFDDRGRLWVIQYLQYPNPAGLKPVKVDQYLRTVYDRLPEPPPRGPKGADKITILEDTNGDSHFRKVRDFAAGLNLASGMALGHAGVFVAQPPYLLFYPDRNGDDIPDGDPEVLLTGFGMEDAHAFPNSLQWGPDGWLYGAQGSTVTSHIRGITFQQGIWRYHPLTREFELFSEGGGNTWGLDFDEHGNTIAGTNFGGTAMLHQVQGAYYIKNFGKHGELQNPYAFGYFDHVPYRGFKGGHVTCGGIIYKENSFPREFQNTYIAGNLLSNALHWHVLEPKGSSFSAHFGGEFLIANDTWFRPVDCLTGPDGSLFVADWYDKRANHVDPVDNWDRSNGRIYKIEATGTKPVAGLALSKLSSNELVGLLNHPNNWFSREAQRILGERRDPGAIPRLRELVLDEKCPLALEALWALYVSGGFDDRLAHKLLDHPMPDVRAWTIRFLGDAKRVSSSSQAQLVQVAGKDQSCVVRNQLACSCKRLPGADSLPIVWKLLERSEDLNDPQIPMLLWWAIEDKAITNRDDILDHFSASRNWEPPLVRKFIIERLGRRYMVEGGEANIAACIRLLAASPGSPDTELVIRGMDKALEGRRLKEVPKALAREIRRLWDKGNPGPALSCLALRLGYPEAMERALKVVSDPNAALNGRVELVEVLGQTENGDCVLVLLDLLEERQPKDLRRAALSALQVYQDSRIPERVLAHYERMPADLRARAQNLLFGRPGSTLPFLVAIDRGVIPASEVGRDQLTRINLYRDPEIHRLLEKHWGKIGPAPAGEKTARIRSLQLIMNNGPGDVAHGKQLFEKHCATCHTLYGQGAKIGPDLTGADRKNRSSLVADIVDPSAVIRKEYVAYIVATKSGRVLNGLIADSTPKTVTILDAKNERIVLDRQEIEEMSPSPQSLMPEKLLDDLQDQDIRDLFAYLQGDAPRTPVPAPHNGPRGEKTPASQKESLKKNQLLKVCLVSGSLEYKSDESLSTFQEYLEANYPIRCTRAFRKTDDDLPGLENLNACDVALFFTRRLTISGRQLELVKKYCQSGKPIVAVRTGSHGFQNWLAFDHDVLGGNYQGHYGAGPVTKVQVSDQSKNHPILQGVHPFESVGGLYRNTGLAPDADVLLTGSIPGGHTEPLAWTRVVNGGRVFYTSLGHPEDFKNEDFRRLLVKALYWTTNRAPGKGAWREDRPIQNPLAPASEERVGVRGALPGTRLLTMEGDIASQLVAGVDRFLLREIDKSLKTRERHWKRDTSCIEKYNESVKANRDHLSRIIGAVDPRIRFRDLELVANTGHPALVGKGKSFEAWAVRWPVFPGVYGEGLLLKPSAGRPAADCIAIPDADQTPEMLAGLVPGVDTNSQFARRLAESGCRVLVPFLIDRRDTYSGIPGRSLTNQPHREWIYRQAFEMGRHIVGYEVQKILAAVDWFEQDSADLSKRIGVFGYGEGGLLAFYAAALDPRISVACVSGYFDFRQNLWQEPIYRNVFGLLAEFGDAELASLVAGRTLIIEASAVPKVEGPPAVRQGKSGGAAPGRLVAPRLEVVERELARARKLIKGLASPTNFSLVSSDGAPGPFGSPTAISSFLGALSVGKLPLVASTTPPAFLRKDFDFEARAKSQFDQLAEHTQHLLPESGSTRRNFWAKADRQSRSSERWKETTKPYRDYFCNEVIGRFDCPLLPPNVQSRKIYDEPKYVGYEIVMDVFPEVMGYGILLVPKDIKEGERRPVVVCQHGLEGRPQDVADPNKDNPAYHRFACRLAERGFVTYAPQNLYIFTDRFRTLQRKANSIKKTLFSIIVPQHQQAVDWLAGLPFVDPERIAFYGLSYGGKTAMRVPPLVERYCLSICSADFNEWILKNTSNRSPYSYLGMGEYEIFEFDLGNTFNYAEMASLIAPRPFMVERGHHDNVAPDEWVAYEYAKVRNLYAALKIPERTEIEFFDGPHTINGVGTFDFLRKHLRWPADKK
jgi:putative membrane-bound dehydrogenase-like protein